MNRLAVRCLLRLPGDNPIVDDHRVHGVRTLPGVTFLDIVYRLLVERGIELGGAGLSDVLFVEPLTTTEDFDREVTVSTDRCPRPPRPCRPPRRSPPTESAPCSPGCATDRSRSTTRWPSCGRGASDEPGTARGPRRGRLR